jgi:hypothetical protein
MKRAAVIGVDGSAQALRAVRLAELALAPLLDWNVVERNEWARLDKELASCSARYPDVGFSPRCLVIDRLIGCRSCPDGRSAWWSDREAGTSSPAFSSAR